MTDWFAMPEREVLHALGSDKMGISVREAKDRLQKYGENVLE